MNNSNDVGEVLADVVVGSKGWLHDEWMLSFYPEDIPKEWCLGFYANEFNTLLVGWEDWHNAIETLKEGLDDTADDFHLYLELPEAHQALPVDLSDIKERVTGLVCAEPEKWQADADNLNIRLFQVLSENGEVFQRLESFPKVEAVEAILLNGANIDDLAMMRAQLELALKITGTRLDCIFVDEVPDMEAMQNTRMIAELMGA